MCPDFSECLMKSLYYLYPARVMQQSIVASSLIVTFEARQDI